MDLRKYMLGLCMFFGCESRVTENQARQGPERTEPNQSRVSVGGPTSTLGDDERIVEGTGLSPSAVLIRASIDLRGRRPSVDEMRALQASPERLNEFVNGFVDSEELGAVLGDLAARWLRSRTVDYPLPGMDSEDTGLAYQRSVGEQPIQQFRFLVDHDRSYDEFLLADYTIANRILAMTWPVDGYDDAGPEWQRVSYKDERPAAGYLASNSFLLRYLTDGINFNRGRANAVSRILLCDDYLLRPIDFPRNIDLTDEDGIKNAVKNQRACISCHDTLDPIASYFAPFSEVEDTGEYNPMMVEDWEETTETAPGFLGSLGDDIRDLSAQIARDPRFARCLTRRLYESFLDRRAKKEDNEAISRHLRAFVQSGLKIRELVRSIAADPAYRGVSTTKRAGTTSKVLSPARLESVILDLTGYALTQERYSLMTIADEGYQILGGGLSPQSGEYPPRTQTVTRVLVQNRLAETAAWFLALSDRPTSTLLSTIDLDDDVANPVEIAQVYARILGTELSPEHEEIIELSRLFQALSEEGLQPRDAWAALVSVILRDPHFVLY